MTPTREEALFALALEKPLAERVASLDRECGRDAALRARLEALLAAHEQASGFLPAEGGGTTVVDPLQTHLPASLADEAEGTLIGRDKLLEKLGDGGCGVVKVGEQTEPVRSRVALKVIKPGMRSGDPSFYNCSLNETDIMLICGHIATQIPRRISGDHPPFSPSRGPAPASFVLGLGCHAANLPLLA